MKKALKAIGIQEILIIIITILILLASIQVINNFSTKSNEDAVKLLEDTLMRAAVQCYAIEGGYPPNLKYLSDNYSIILDEEKYFYHYDVQGSNIAPKIMVIKR